MAKTDTMGDWKRSCLNGEVVETHEGSTLTLMGWVQKRRDHGGLIFVDLRDRTGVVQLVFSPDEEKEVHEKAHAIRSEFVLAIKGEVRKRPEGTDNENLTTGTIEVIVKEYKLLSESEVPPFMIEEDTDVSEDLRLKYRYLDLRRKKMQQNLILRHDVMLKARNYLSDNKFLEIETPILTKSTPEGARDFLVPSRLNSGHFFALPQSPQIFKQILMISGFDRYFQIVKCFRDEDLRADRQPEFTQIDAELSFVDEHDVMEIMEDLIRIIFKDCLGKELGEFSTITYDEAISKYGLDAPDVRFGLHLKDISHIVKDASFKVFRTIVEEGGIVKAINVRDGAKFSRKDLDDLTNYASTYGGKGLAWVKMTEEGWQSPIAKFFTDEEKDSISKELEAGEGDLLLFSADKPNIVNTVLGRVRLEVGKRMELIDKSTLDFVWVTDFPMFEYDDSEKRYQSMHHPFTAPKEEDLDKLDSDPLLVKTQAYDLVLNGVEIGGGSIRINQRDVQAKIFKLLGISDEEANDRFGFLLDALKFGTPPHGGIAFGLDRLLAIMTESDSIREVIAFPKTQKAQCLLSEAPSGVDGGQLEQLYIRTVKKKP